MNRSLAFAACALAAFCSGTANATVWQFNTTLGPEVLGATGNGWVDVVYDDALRTLSIDTSFSGLSGVTTVSHIHCCTASPGTGTAGVAVTPGTLPGFPAGVSSGTYFIVLDLSDTATYTGAFLTAGGGTAAGAEARLFNGLMDGVAYFNVHSTSFGSGEIRGFLQPVPEPSTYALMALGLAAVGAAARRRRRA